MSENLILTAAIGYNFKDVELFVKSLRKYYSGKICFIIGYKDQKLESELKKYECDLIKTNVHKKQIQFKRYQIFFDYLKNLNFDHVLLCDSRDIYFQKNPFDFNYKGRINFFLEDYKIKDCPYNSNWIKKTYGIEEFNKINEKTILCSGTVLGNNNEIKNYLELISKYISKFKYKKKLKYFLTLRTDPEQRGCDQGHANYLVHKSIIKDINLYSNLEGPFATVFYLKKIIFDKENRLINGKGDPYLIVHQYDKRWNEFEKIVTIIKARLGIK